MSGCAAKALVFVFDYEPRAQLCYCAGQSSRFYALYDLRKILVRRRRFVQRILAAICHNVHISKGTIYRLLIQRPHGSLTPEGTASEPLPIGAALGMGWVMHSVRQLRGHQFGNVVLSRHPIVHHGHYDLTWRSCEERACQREVAGEAERGLPRQ